VGSTSSRNQRARTREAARCRRANGDVVDSGVSRSFVRSYAGIADWLCGLTSGVAWFASSLSVCGSGSRHRPTDGCCFCRFLSRLCSVSVSVDARELERAGAAPVRAPHRTPENALVRADEAGEEARRGTRCRRRRVCRPARSRRCFITTNDGRPWMSDNTPGRVRLP